MLGVGHSMGGAAMVLTALARPDIFNGGAIAAYEPVLLDLNPIFQLLTRFRALNPLSRTARSRKNGWGSSEEVLEYFATRGAFSRLPAHAVEALAMGCTRKEHILEGTGTEDVGDVGGSGGGGGGGGGYRLKCDPIATEAQLYRYPARMEALSDLAKVPGACPVHLVVGSLSKPMGPGLTLETFKRQHEIISKGAGGTSVVSPSASPQAATPPPLQIVEGAGHFGPLEKPAQIAEIILSMARGLGRSNVAHL